MIDSIPSIENNKNIFEISGDESILDTTKLLNRYFKIARYINSNSNTVYTKVKQCNKYIIDLSYNAEPFVKNEIAILNNEISNLEKDRLQLKKEFDLTQDPVEKRNIANRLSNKIDKVNKAEAKFYDMSKAFDETIDILKPIYASVIKLRKLVFNLKWIIRWYKIRKIVINTLLILVIAFTLNLFFDLLQNFTESQVDLNHFVVLTIAFLLQTFCIDPLILSKLKSKFDWILINRLRHTLPELKLELETEKEIFNKQISGWIGLNKFYIE